MQIPTGAEAFHSDPPPPVPFPLSGLPPYLSPFPPVILHVHHLLPPPTSPSLDFPHTCPPYRPPRKDKVVEDLDQDHQQELKPPPVGTTASSPPPYLTSGHTLRARPPSPMLPFSSQDEVVEDLDRDHQQELKRIVFSLELKRIR